MFCSRHTVLPALFLAGAFTLPALAPAQMPLARLLTVFPPGGRSGTAVEVNLTGLDLDEANRLHFTQPGITATAKPEPNRFVVTIASNTPPGIYEVRVIGRFGVSNPRAFVVGELPEIIASSGNNLFATAMEIAPGTTINGTANPNSADYFKFTAKTGQRTLIESQAKTIDSRMECSLTLYAADGRELERSRLGGLLDFKVPADGQYLLKVHDFLFRGGGEYFYRITLDIGPRIDFVLPPSGVPGAKSKHTLYGRNLPGSVPAKDISIDGKPLEQLAVEIEFPKADLALPKPSLLSNPAQAVVDGFDYRLRTPTGVSNPALLSFATGLVIAEQAGNDKPEAAQKVTLPCEYTGQFYPARDVDWITFDAKKGEVCWVEIFSQRLGLPTDPFVLIQRVMKNDKGQLQGLDVLEMYDTDANVGGAEFKTSTHDPVARFEVKEDGAYRLRVQDLFNQSESDPRRVYRLSLRRENPDFRLVAIPEAPPPLDKAKKEAFVWTTLVRRGESIPVQVMVFRRDGFGGEIQLSADGLPPGVTCVGAQIEAGKNSAFLVISAAENAANWFGPIKIVGKARIGTNEVSREARAGCLLWNVGDYNTEPVSSRLDAGMFLAVSDKESAPLIIQAAENKVWEAAATAKLQIPLKIVRRAEFGEALKLKLVGLSALDKLKELEVAGQATNTTLEIDLSQYQVPPGAHTLHLQARTKGKYRNNPEAAAQTETALKAAEKAAVDLAAEAKKAADALPAAIKAAEEAAAQAKAISDKDRVAALAKAKAAADAKAPIEKTANEVAGKVKAAEARRIAAANEAKVAGDLAATARKTADALAAAVKAAEETAAQAKAVADKDEAAAAARTQAAADAEAAAEKTANETVAKLKDDEAKKAAAAAAAKAAADLAAEAKKTSDVLAAATKAAEEAATQAKTIPESDKAAGAAKAKIAADAKIVAEKTAADAAAKVKDAEAKMTAANNEAKAAADLAIAAKKNADALAAAAKAAEDAAAQAKALAGKGQAAAVASAKTVVDAKVAFEKAASDAAAKAKVAETKMAAAANSAKAAADLAPEAKKATDALAVATKAAEDAAAPARAIAEKDSVAAARAKAAADAKTAAEKAAGNLKDAEARKTAAANAAKAAAAKAKPRDVTIMVYSAPITISAQPAPKK